MLAVLRQQKWGVFRRIELHLLRQFAATMLNEIIPNRARPRRSGRTNEARTFVRFFFNSLETASKTEKTFAWEPILSLALWVVEQPRTIPGRHKALMEADPDWSWSRGTVATLLEAGMQQRPGEIPFTQREAVWQVLVPLTTDPDPTREHEAKYGGKNMDPATMAINTVRGKALIDGEDLTMSWHCTGYCRARRSTSMEFSIDADANIPFARLDCIAFDLRHDPQKRHAIRPILVGPAGMSKKIAVPFLAPLTSTEPFSLVLRCRLPGCMKAGVDYYAATVSFAQETVPALDVRLRFVHGAPLWIRAYECRPGGMVSLIRDLRPTARSKSAQEYVDSTENVPGASARIYLFERPTLDNVPEEADQELAALTRF